MHILKPINTLSSNLVTTSILLIQPIWNYDFKYVWINTQPLDKSNRQYDLRDTNMVVGKNGIKNV